LRRSVRQHGVDVVDRDAGAGAAIARRHDVEVLLHGQVGEDPAPLGQQPQAAREAVADGALVDPLAGQPDLPFARRQQAQNGLQRGRLAGAVVAEEGEDLPGVEREGHVVDHRAIAVARDQMLDLEQHQIAPPK
jgi:hypothetical protein